MVLFFLALISSSRNVFSIVWRLLREWVLLKYPVLLFQKIVKSIYLFGKRLVWKLN